jgi:hypothetical protein
LLEQERRSAVAIDLTDVLLVDREAVKFLALRESNGAELRNCPAYIRAIAPGNPKEVPVRTPPVVAKKHRIS